MFPALVPTPVRLRDIGTRGDIHTNRNDEATSNENFTDRLLPMKPTAFMLHLPSLSPLALLSSTNSDIYSMCVPRGLRRPLRDFSLSIGSRDLHPTWSDAEASRNSTSFMPDAESIYTHGSTAVGGLVAPLVRGLPSCDGGIQEADELRR